jgi:hypothetical protein
MQTTRPLNPEEVAMQLAERFGAVATIDLAPAVAPDPDPLEGEAIVPAITVCMLEFPAGLEIRDSFNAVVRVARVPFKVAPAILQSQFDRFPESKFPQQQLSFGDEGAARPVLSAAAARCWRIISAAEDWAYIASQYRSVAATTADATTEPEPASGGEPAPPKRGRRGRITTEGDLES